MKTDVLVVALAVLGFGVVLPRGTSSSLLCPPLAVAEGVRVSCTSPEGSAVSCDVPLLPGAKATLSCRPFYTNIRRNLNMTCRSSGQWSTFRSFDCQVECGKSNEELQPLIANGYGTAISKWPWHVALFLLRSRDDDGRGAGASSLSTRDYSYICGGALISSSAVLTAAHCLVDNAGSVRNVTTLALVLAPLSSDFKSNMQMSDGGATVMSLRSVAIHPRYNWDNYDGDVALVQLHHRLQFTDQIRPVCLPSASTQHSSLSINSSGYVVGFGKTERDEVSEILREAMLPVISTKSCSQSLGFTHGYSQYCAGYVNGTAACAGDSGGGMYFPAMERSSSRFIVQGIVSYARKGKCDNYSVFTRVSSFSSWIQVVESNFSATIPEESGTGTTNGRDQKLCGSLRVPEHMDVVCFSNSSEAARINCSSAEFSAVARFSCKKDFMGRWLRAAGGSSLASSRVECVDGEWEETTFECEPECGVVVSTSPPVQGLPEQPRALPWHARVYQGQRGKDGGNLLLCGGSLIEKRFVLTSAECVTQGTGSLRSTLYLNVLLGANGSVTEERVFSPSSQSMQQVIRVKKIHVPPTFDRASLTSNVALLELLQPAVLTRRVKRICYLREAHPEDDYVMVAKVANYLDELKRDYNAERSVATLPATLCFQIGLEVPPRTFCATSSSSGEFLVCRNDSGHGLFQELEGNFELHVLRGVMSKESARAASEPCSFSTHAVYTQVEAFGAWILDIVAGAADA